MDSLSEPSEDDPLAGLLGAPAPAPSVRRRALWLLLLLAFLLAVRWPSFDDALLNVDEAFTLLLADTLLEGQVPYRDAVDHRAPLTYVVYAGAMAVGGRRGLALHLASFAWIALATVVLWDLGRRALGFRAACVGAVVFAWMGATHGGPANALAFHTEWVMVLCTCAAFWLLWRASRGDLETGWRLGPRRGLLYLASGACFGLGVLAKQPAGLDAAASGLFVALACWRSQPAVWMRATAARGAWMLVGFCGVLGAAALLFWWGGAIEDLYYYGWRYNHEIYLKAPRPADATPGAVALVQHLLAWPLVCVFLAIVAAIQTRVLWQQRREPAAHPGWPRAGVTLLALWCAAAMVGAALSGRGFYHYDIQFLPALALLAGLSLSLPWEQLVQREPRWAYRLAIHLVLWIGLVNPVSGGHWFFQGIEERTLGTSGLNDLRPLAAHVRDTTEPDDAIFLWGFAPEVYLQAERRPAARFVYCTFVAGLVHGANNAPELDTRAWRVPGSEATLVDDLRRSRPALIVDTQPAGYRDWGKYPLELFSELQAFIAAHYEREPAPRGIRSAIYRRKG